MNEDLTPLISLWQPWASWIAWGWKGIETRFHDRFACLAFQTIGIHAASRVDPKWKISARNFLTIEQLERTSRELPTLPKSAVVCRVLVEQYCRRLAAKHSQAALIDCSLGNRSGLILSLDVEVFDPPIPMRGRQGIWRAKL